MATLLLRTTKKKGWGLSESCECRKLTLGGIEKLRGGKRGRKEGGFELVVVLAAVLGI